MHEVAKDGVANLLISDGRDLAVFRDPSGARQLFWGRRGPHGPKELESETVKVSFDGALDSYRTGVVVSTEPLTSQGWYELMPGELVVIRRGAFVYSSGADCDDYNRLLRLQPGPLQTSIENRVEVSSGMAALKDQGQPTVLESTVAVPTPLTPIDAEVELEVSHRTTYRYERAVEVSRHLFRLQPALGARQRVLDFELQISPEGKQGRYDDVFGNAVVRIDIDQPFKELDIVMRARVRRLPEHRGPVGTTRRRATLPIPWMPWDRQMMSPYLLPTELPETQLRELFDYAMSFVERQDDDLLATLDDLNVTIYREFVYTPGFTTLETTPFEVYTQRKGVCQDFANLLICLARLLGVPARYRTGYIFTGANYENKIQSEASHAWAELFLPGLGWQGFDPTNGCRAEGDHILVACGRNYRDATPTSGTIYRGGGRESLEIDVKVRRVEDDLGNGA